MSQQGRDIINSDESISRRMHTYINWVESLRWVNALDDEKLTREEISKRIEELQDKIGKCLNQLFLEPEQR